MAKIRLTRRRFLAETAKGALAAPMALLNAEALTAGQQPPAPTNLRATLKPILSQQDLSFLGAFRLPFSAGGQDAGWGRGLTFRRVGSDLRFLSTTADAGVYEVADPGISATPPFPLAKVIRFWGDVGASVRYTTEHGVGTGRVNGLYWDAPDSRLYWSYADEYNAVSSTDPSLGCSTLDDASGTSTAVGVWHFGPRGCKATSGGVLPIPPWFADAYCAGRRLGAGFGGYFSIVTTGPAHMGPSLCAFAPPDIATNANRSAIPYTALVGYPYNAPPYTIPGRCHRDTDYTNEFDQWNPKNGIGYWSWSDMLWQGAVWIDLPNKHGVVFFPTLGNGRTWYETSTLHAERGSHWCFVYDPMDLAAVAGYRIPQYQAQPAARWPIKYPGLTYPLPGWADEPMYMVVGTSYDPATQRLYVAVRLTWSGTNVGEHGQTVYVYQVA